VQKTATIVLLGLVVLFLREGLAQQPASSQEDAPLVHAARIPLGVVVGRIDHFTMDRKHNRVIVSALANNTVEIVDMVGQRQSQTITGQDGPQGVLYVQEFDKLFVANDGGKVNIYDGSSYKFIDAIDFKDDADNLRYDETEKRVYVGYGDGAIAMIDANTNQRLPREFKLDEHPESFQLETRGSRIFVNLPVANSVGVIDRRTGAMTKWKFEGSITNFAMALDEDNHRLFVNFRNPSRLVVFDTGSGAVVATLPVVVDCDDLYYDVVRKRIYLTGAQGFVDVIRQVDANTYLPVARIRTYVGARTSGWFTSRPRTGLIVAVPANSTQGAELWFFQVQD
jgi:DNA-binding beta-propeller fold protein YncE